MEIQAWSWTKLPDQVSGSERVTELQVLYISLASDHGSEICASLALDRGSEFCTRFRDYYENQVAFVDCTRLLELYLNIEYVIFIYLDVSSMFLKTGMLANLSTLLLKC